MIEGKYGYKRITKGTVITKIIKAKKYAMKIKK